MSMGDASASPYTILRLETSINRQVIKNNLNITNIYLILRSKIVVIFSLLTRRPLKRIFRAVSKQQLLKTRAHDKIKLRPNKRFRACPVLHTSLHLHTFVCIRTSTNLKTARFPSLSLLCHNFPLSGHNLKISSSRIFWFAAVTTFRFGEPADNRRSSADSCSISFVRG